MWDGGCLVGHSDTAVTAAVEAVFVALPDCRNRLGGCCCLELTDGLTVLTTHNHKETSYSAQRRYESVSQN